MNLTDQIEAASKELADFQQSIKPQLERERELQARLNKLKNEQQQEVDTAEKRKQQELVLELETADLPDLNEWQLPRFLSMRHYYRHSTNAPHFEREFDKFTLVAVITETMGDRSYINWQIKPTGDWQTGLVGGFVFAKQNAKKIRKELARHIAERIKLEIEMVKEYPV